MDCLNNRLTLSTITNKYKLRNQNSNPFSVNNDENQLNSIGKNIMHTMML